MCTMLVAFKELWVDVGFDKWLDEGMVVFEELRIDVELVRRLDEGLEACEEADAGLEWLLLSDVSLGLADP